MEVQEAFRMDVRDKRTAAWERAISSNKEKIYRRSGVGALEELRIALIPVKRILLLFTVQQLIWLYCCTECYNNASENRLDLSSVADNTALVAEWPNSQRANHL